MKYTKSISGEQAEKLIKENKEVILLDVRRYSEFKESRIPNAINIPVDDLEWEVEDINKYKEKPIIVYCKVGMRSSVACDILEGEGFTKLYNLRGGILDYNGEIQS